MAQVQRWVGRERPRMIAGVMALVAGLALFSLARAPGASGQLIGIGVGNSGSGTAGTGGNTATGNNSANNASVTNAGTSGGLLSADVGLGAPTNTSTGTANVTTGPANAAGNTSGTGINQASDGGSSFTPFFSQPAGQLVGVTNDGTATASTGGNTATGNNSDNTAGTTLGGGAIGVNVGLGGPTNTSSGDATINTGPANAAGNTAGTEIDQSRVAGDPSGGFIAGTPFGPGVFPGTVSGFGSSFDPCSGRFFPFSPFLNGQSASVDNAGTATASTGGNTAVGNNSTNTATVTQTASGGLIGLNINLGSPTNNSTGSANINTGAANASGNSSTTGISQFCGQAAGATPVVARNPITGAPFAVPVIISRNVVTRSLARTGLESSLAMVAAALVLAGMALLLPARRRLAEAEGGNTVRPSEWDNIVRW